MKCEILKHEKQRTGELASRSGKTPPSRGRGRAGPAPTRQGVAAPTPEQGEVAGPRPPEEPPGGHAGGFSGEAESLDLRPGPGLWAGPDHRFRVNTGSLSRWCPLHGTRMLRVQSVRAQDWEPTRAMPTPAPAHCSRSEVVPRALTRSQVIRHHWPLAGGAWCCCGARRPDRAGPAGKSPATDPEPLRTSGTRPALEEAGAGAAAWARLGQTRRCRKPQCAPPRASGVGRLTGPEGSGPRVCWFL